MNARGRQFKKVFSCKAVLDSPMVKYPSSHLHFPSSLNLEPHSKVDFGASDFEAAVGLQVEAAGKLNVAAGVLDHRTIQTYFA